MIEDIIIILAMIGIIIAEYTKQVCEIIEREDPDNGIEDLLWQIFTEGEIQ